MSNEIATYSMILSKLSLGKSGTECPTKTQILAINSLIVIDNASTYGANECVKIDDIRKKVETWNYYLTVSPTSMSFAAAAGAMPLTISSYKRKTINGVEQSGDTAVSLKSIVASGSGFSVSGTTVYASANEDTTDRTGTVTITQNESNKTVTISLLQYGREEAPDVYEYVFSVNPYKVNVDSSGGSGQIAITSYETLNGSWHRHVGYSIDSSTLPSWASFNKSTSTFTIQSTTSTVGRTAKVYFDQDESGKRDYAEITQTGYTPPADNYVFTWHDGSTSSKSESFQATGAVSAAITLVSTKNGSNHPWSTTSYPSWITIVGETATIVTIQASNNTGSARSGSVVLTQEDSGKTLTINVSQDAKPADEYVFEIADSSSGPYGSSVSWTLPASGSLNKDIYLRSKKNGENVGWSASSNASWIIVVRDYPDFYWEYENNNTAYSRSGKITFTQEGSGKKVYLNLTQEGKPQITFTATVAGKNIHTQSWDVPTSAKTVSAVLPFPSSWSTSDEFEVKLRHNDMGDGSWTGSTQVGTMANYDRKSSITIENKRDSSVTFTVEYWFKGMDYIFHMWPADNTSGVYTSGTQSVDLQIVSKFFKEQHPLKVQSQPEWCTAYISGSDGNGIYNIDLLIQSNPLTQSRTGTIVFEQEDSGMTTSFTVSQGGAILKDNKLTITSLRYDTAFLFPAGITPVEGPNVYLSFIVPNTFTWKTSTGLTVNRGTIYAGELANIYVRENNRYKLVESFQLETGEQTITI